MKVKILIVFNFSVLLNYEVINFEYDLTILISVRFYFIYRRLLFIYIRFFII